MPTLTPVSRLSLKNILFPTDFSPASRAALPLAESLAQVYGSTILFAHAISPEPLQQIVPDRLPAQDDLVWEEAREKLETFAHAHSLTAKKCKTLLERGDLVDIIPSIIAEQHVDLVVLGTHGRRGVAKLIRGSAAEKIYRTATCPVLTVGPRAQGAADWKPSRILCPVDSAEDPEPVLHYALSLAEENQAEFIVLEAFPLVAWQHRPWVEAQARHALDILIPEQSKDWCTPQIVIRWDYAADAILHEAHEREADLIVMSVHKARASTLSAHLPWPVASEVVGRAQCPVLTIRV